MRLLYHAGPTLPCQPAAQQPGRVTLQHHFCHRDFTRQDLRCARRGRLVCPRTLTGGFMRTRSTLLSVSFAVLLTSGAVGCGNGDDNSSPVPAADAGGSDATHSEAGSGDGGLPDGTTAGDAGSA